MSGGDSVTLDGDAAVGFDFMPVRSPVRQMLTVPTIAGDPAG
jgi:hypothetical protein